MGVLLIRCPKTNRDFSTGIHVDADTLARVPQEFTHTHCPYCKTQHFWLPREAKLVEAFPHRNELKTRGPKAHTSCTDHSATQHQLVL